MRHWWKTFKLLTPWTTESTVLQWLVGDRRIYTKTPLERALILVSDIFESYSRDKMVGIRSRQQ